LRIGISIFAVSPPEAVAEPAAPATLPLWVLLQAASANTAADIIRNLCIAAPI
jgi:hypothetical protein